MAMTPAEIERLKRLEEQRRMGVVSLLGDTGETTIDPNSPFSNVLLGLPDTGPVPQQRPDMQAPQVDPTPTASVTPSAPTADPAPEKRGGLGGWWDDLGKDGQNSLGSALMAMSGGILGSNNGQDVWSALGGGMTAAGKSFDSNSKDATQIELNKQRIAANQRSLDQSSRKEQVQAEIAKTIQDAGPNWMTDATTKNKVAALYNSIGEYDAATKLVGGQGNLADTADMKEYRFYVEQETSAGRTPMAFGDWQVKKAGGVGRKPDLQANLDRINAERATQGKPALTMEDYQKQTNQAASDQKFAEKAGEDNAAMFKTMATDGFAARGDLDNIDTMASALTQTPGGFSNIVVSTANQWGLGDLVSKNASSVQLADAMINKLVPQQRPAGSGAMSDADLDLFKKSLPQLQGTADGNAMIVETMRGMAAYKRDMGVIAQRAMGGEISQTEALQQMRDLPDPLASFKAKRKDLTQRDNNANATLGGTTGTTTAPSGGVRLPDGRYVRPRQGGR